MNLPDIYKEWVLTRISPPSLLPFKDVKAHVKLYAFGIALVLPYVILVVLQFLFFSDLICHNSGSSKSCTCSYILKRQPEGCPHYFCNRIAVRLVWGSLHLVSGQLLSLTRAEVHSRSQFSLVCSFSYFRKLSCAWKFSEKQLWYGKKYILRLVVEQFWHTVIEPLKCWLYEIIMLTSQCY